ncbi:MAG: TolC family outer membrane protein [Alphaproteobacteria bacterium]|nr:MAG: TolC family outer membrane protein [Alphaproteobacteria bacterium]
MAAWPQVCLAETMESALVQAYQTNPQLNAQRANARATDENVPQALSGYRPKLSITATAGEQYTDTVTKANSQGVNTYQHAHGTTSPWTAGGTATQTLFNGFQTANRTRAAESQVSAAREGLRVMEQTVLLAAATAYMDVLRDTANLEVQRTNVRVLEETLKQTRDRFNVGEVTRTDVAQAEAQLAAGQSAVAAAESVLNTSRANYRQVVGTEPVNLAPGSPVDRFSPRVLLAAIDTGLTENPNVTAAMYGVDVAHLQVKINEGALFPNLSLQGNVQHASFPQLSIVHQFTTSIIGQITVPIYQGGGEYSLVRQSKESLAQQRLNLDLVRNQARQAVVQAWGQLQAAKAQIAAAQSQVASSEVALNGVREEARVGQRTTLDVLNAQQALVNARVALVAAQHDRVVASYNLLAAVGRLSPQVLGLATNVYDPMVHYQQVRDAWYGIRIPDGR